MGCGIKEAGIGVIARNCDGLVAAGTTNSSVSSSALLVEAAAALEGLKLAKSHGFQDVILEVDFKQLKRLFSVASGSSTLL